MFVFFSNSLNNMKVYFRAFSHFESTVLTKPLLWQLWTLFTQDYCGSRNRKMNKQSVANEISANLFETLLLLINCLMQYSLNI